MTVLWEALTSASWRSVPSVQGRVATDADVQAGRAVFYVPTGSKPYPLSLPVCAIHRDEETGKATSIVVIQAEEAPGQIVLGARPLEGGNMVCTLPEVELVQHPEEGFFRQV